MTSRTETQTLAVAMANAAKAKARAVALHGTEVGHVGSLFAGVVRHFGEAHATVVVQQMAVRLAEELELLVGRDAVVAFLATAG